MSLTRRRASWLVLLVLTGTIPAIAQFPPATAPRPALPPTNEPFHQPPPPTENSGGLSSGIIPVSFRVDDTSVSLPVPRRLPAAMTPSIPISPDQLAPLPVGLPDQSLPMPENKIPINLGTLNLRRFGDSWQIWTGTSMLRNFGSAEADAREVHRVMRELKVNEWVRIGSPVPSVEYGLYHGRAPVASGVARFALPIDLRSVRAERVKGVWVLRDENSVFINFGTHRSDAEQAAAVVQKYGFDRVGYVGQPQPVMTFFFVAPPNEKMMDSGLGSLGAQIQIEAMTRTGIPVPGLGFVGEMIRIDYRKVEVRREAHEWVLAHGSDVLGRFGAGEWQARDALKVVQEGRFTEWCQFAGVRFFLSGGRAPSKPLFAQIVREFDERDLAVRQINGQWFVHASHRPLFQVETPQEGEDLIRILRHFGFNQLCQSGNSSKPTLTFLTKAR